MLSPLGARYVRLPNIIKYTSHISLNLIQSSSPAGLNDHAVTLGVFDLLLPGDEGQEAQYQDHGEPHGECHDD